MPLINSSDVTERVVLAPGVYDAQFAEHKEGTTGKGDPKEDLVFEIVSDDEAISGMKLYRTCTLTPKSLWSFKETTIALGADPAVWEPGNSLDTGELLDELIGGYCRLQIANRVYEERVQNDIRKVLAPDGGFPGS